MPSTTAKLTIVQNASTSTAVPYRTGVRVAPMG